MWNELLLRLWLLLLLLLLVSLLGELIAEGDEWAAGSWKGNGNEMFESKNSKIPK